MNPYAPIFSNPADVGIAWLCVVGWLVVVEGLIRRRFITFSTRSEQFCLATASAFLALAVAIMFIYGVGLIFLVWLKVTSVFWFLWQLLFLMSVVCVFRVLPIIALGLICWAFLGRWRSGFSKRSVRLASICIPAVVVDAALYFCLCYELAA